MLTQLLTILPKYNIHLDFYIWLPNKKIFLIWCFIWYAKNKHNLISYSSSVLQKISWDNRIYIQSFFFQLSHKRISLFSVLSNRIIEFVTYHPHYKKKLEIIVSKYNPFFFWQSLNLILLLYISYDYIIKIMKLAYYELKVGKHLFAIYYLY